MTCNEGSEGCGRLRKVAEGCGRLRKVAEGSEGWGRKVAETYRIRKVTFGLPWFFSSILFNQIVSHPVAYRSLLAFFVNFVFLSLQPPMFQLPSKSNPLVILVAFCSKFPLPQIKNRKSEIENNTTPSLHRQSLRSPPLCNLSSSLFNPLFAYHLFPNS